MVSAEGFLLTGSTAGVVLWCRRRVLRSSSSSRASCGSTPARCWGGARGAGGAGGGWPSAAEA